MFSHNWQKKPFFFCQVQKFCSKSCKNSKPHDKTCKIALNPFRTAVFVLVTNYVGLEWLVSKTGPQFLPCDKKGLSSVVVHSDCSTQRCCQRYCPCGNGSASTPWPWTERVPQLSTPPDRPTTASKAPMPAYWRGGGGGFYSSNT